MKKRPTKTTVNEAPERDMNREYYYNLMWGPSHTSIKKAQAEKNRTKLAGSAEYHIYTVADFKADRVVALKKLKEVEKLFAKEQAAGEPSRSRKMGAIKKAAQDLGGFPRYLENQMYSSTGYGAMYDGETPWKELSDMQKAGIVRTQAQIKKKKETINQLLTRIGLDPIMFTNLGDDEVTEGWHNVPPINKDRYQERPGLEGPFQTRVGKVIYYDPKEGSYYDPDSDIYLTYDEFKSLDESDYMKHSKDGGAVNKLPPHLAKFIDPTTGNFTQEVEARLQKGRKPASNWKDVTPKGYGPSEGAIMSSIREVDAVRRPTREAEARPTVRGNDVNYMMIERVGGKAPATGNRWSIMNYPNTAGANPTHLRKMLDAHSKQVGFESYDVVAQWSGDIDEELIAAQEKLDSGKTWIASYSSSLKDKVRNLSNAKRIMSSGQESNPMEEAKDPMGVINKFLAKKASRETRNADLAANPQKVYQPTELPVEDNLNEYKPGVTVLTREISFADLDDTELSNHYDPDAEYATVKKIRWPYGIEVSFSDRDRTVRFKTAKMKTVAKILEKHIDFGATSAAEVLELPQELMQSADTDFLPSGKNVVEADSSKWDYPKNITRAKPVNDMGGTNAKANREKHKAHRAKIKANQHTELMRGQKA